jgi:dipeptidyl aminopeptidase/acylaminoacyl peptidase
MFNSFRLFLASAATLGLVAFLPAKPPPVSDNVEILIKKLFGSPVFEGIALSPTGTHLAFIREEKGHKVLATIDLRTKEVHGVSGSWQQNVVSFYWCGPETLLFQVGLDKANHYQGLFLSDPEFKNLRVVPVRRKVFVPYDVRPSHAFLRDAYPADMGWGPPYSPLYRLDPEKNRIDVVEENPGRVVDWLADDNGRVRYAIRWLDEDNTKLLERGEDRNSWKDIPFVKDPRPLSLDQTGTFLLLRYLGEDGLMRVGTFNIKNHRFEGRQLSDPQYDVDPDVFMDPKTGVPAGLFYEAGRSVVFWLDPGYQKIQAYLNAAVRGAEARPWGVTYDGRILLGLEGDTWPLTLYLLNLKDGKMSPILPQLPDAIGRPWAPMRDVTFRSRDSHVIHAYLTLPLSRKNGQRVPLIALSHGGPVSRDIWGFDPQAQFFAALGYGVLQVNYRGSSGFGREYALNDIIEVNRRSVDDVADGLKWTVGEGYADSRRLIAIGGSYGGYISVALATRYPELPAAIVGLAGVYDWYAEILNGIGQTSISASGYARYYPGVGAHGDEYREVSPLNNADKVRAPVLLIHGSDDRRVDYDQSQSMANALKKAGKTVQLVSDVVSIHGMPDQESRLKYFQTVASFLLKNVPPDAAP